MIIKHLVLSGGGPNMIQKLAAIQYLDENSIIKRENIKSIYGTSAGAMIGVLYCMNFDWETINDYIIKRPWYEVFPIKIQNIFDAYTKKGIFDIETIKKCFKPLLSAKDLNLNINLKDFYEFSKIEMHFLTFELNTFHMVDVSYKSHPDLSLIVAIQMTCALPVLISPVLMNDCCYIDGGVECNYPLNFCLENNPDEVDNILGFKNYYIEEIDHNIHNESTLLDFFMNFLFKLLFKINIDSTQPKIPYEIICNTKHMSIEYFKNALKSEDVRKELFQSGIETATLFIEQIEKQFEQNLENDANI